MKVWIILAQESCVDFEPQVYSTKEKALARVEELTKNFIDRYDYPDGELENVLSALETRDYGFLDDFMVSIFEEIVF